jgi:hypothetical protein
VQEDTTFWINSTEVFGGSFRRAFRQALVRPSKVQRSLGTRKFDFNELTLKFQLPIQPWFVYNGHNVGDKPASNHGPCPGHLML